MRFACIAAGKDLRRRLADPLALLMWIGLPIVIGALLSLIGGDDGPAPKAHVLLVDEDQTLVSRLVGQAGRSGQLATFLDIEDVATAVEGRARMDAGDASALVVIPSGFQDAVLREKPAALTLVTNPAQRILPVIVQEGLGMAVEATFYAQRLFGPVVTEIADRVQGEAAPTDAVVLDLGRSVRERLTAVQSTLVPPVLTLTVERGDAAGVSEGFGSLFLPGLLFMAILFTAQGMSLDVWTERAIGTLARSLATPERAVSVLGGKLLAAVVVMMAAVAAGLALGVAVFDVSLARAVAALAWSAFAGAALFAYLLLLQLGASSARGAQLLTSLLVFPLMMIGGSFFPFEIMPAWMAAVGRWTPNGQSVAVIKQILFGQIELRGLLVSALAVGLPALMAFAWAARRLRRAAGAD